jgi:hypothetical protein
MGELEEETGTMRIYLGLFRREKNYNLTMGGTILSKINILEKTTTIS